MRGSIAHSFPTPAKDVVVLFEEAQGTLEALPLLCKCGEMRRHQRTLDYDLIGFFILVFFIYEHTCICTRCHEIIEPKLTRKGSAIIAVILLICGFLPE